MQRCLIVDNSPVVAKVAKRLLSDKDYVVVTATTSSEGLAACRNDMPDIVVIDLGLRDCDPIEMIAEVKAMRGRVQPTIIASIVEADIVHMMKARRAGAAEFLQKPFDRQLIHDAFEEFEQIGKTAA